jgi:hypothetical protein
MASALLFIEPCRFPSLHVGLRLVGREELAIFELTKSPLDLFGYLVLSLMEPFIFAAQHFQRSPDDLVWILIGAGLNRLRDRFFVFGAKGNGHTGLSLAIVANSSAISGKHGKVKRMKQPASDGKFRYLLGGLAAHVELRFGGLQTTVKVLINGRGQ